MLNEIVVVRLRVYIRKAISHCHVKHNVTLFYRVFGDGRIQTTLHYDPVEGLAAMPEFGVLFKIDADYDTVEWYGNGPAETYWDLVYVM